MRGYRVPRKAGWDCHGLPVELEVEKQLGISSKQEIEEYGIAEFNQRCRESVFEYVEEWNRLTERIGFWIDLDDPYVTLDDDYIESVWWSLRQLWDDGPPLRGPQGRPLLPALRHRRSPRTRSRWATRTSRTRPSTCASRCSTRTAAEAGESLLVWTTTPWTLPGNVAVAVGARGRPTCGRGVDGEILILAEAAGREGARRGGRGARRSFPGSDAGRAAATRARSSTLADCEPARPPGPRRRLRHHRGRHRPRPHRPRLRRGRLRGRRRERHLRPDRARHALQPGRPRRQLRRPGHRLRGPLRQGPRGDPRADRRPRAPRPALPRAGLRARLPALLALRHAAPLLREVELVRRAPPRSATEMLANNETIGWHPEHIKHGRFGKWLENNVDWALSRDRYWGTPLPIWECDGDGLRRSASAPARSPSCASAPAARSPTTCTAPTSTRSTLDCETCGGEMRRVESVIDTWYDSGAMPFAQFHYPFENEERVRGALPGRLHLRGDRPDPRLVLHAARRVDPALRHAPATATASASA